jgi:hypothetical protein
MSSNDRNSEIDDDDKRTQNYKSNQNTKISSTSGWVRLLREVPVLANLNARLEEERDRLIPWKNVDFDDQDDLKHQDSTMEDNNKPKYVAENNYQYDSPEEVICKMSRDESSPSSKSESIPKLSLLSVRSSQSSLATSTHSAPTATATTTSSRVSQKSAYSESPSNHSSIAHSSLSSFLSSTKVTNIIPEETFAAQSQRDKSEIKNMIKDDMIQQEILDIHDHSVNSVQAQELVITREDTFTKGPTPLLLQQSSISIRFPESIGSTSRIMGDAFLSTSNESSLNYSDVSDFTGFTVSSAFFSKSSRSINPLIRNEVIISENPSKYDPVKDQQEDDDSTTMSNPTIHSDHQTTTSIRYEDLPDSESLRSEKPDGLSVCTEEESHSPSNIDLITSTSSHASHSPSKSNEGQSFHVDNSSTESFTDYSPSKADTLTAYPLQSSSVDSISLKDLHVSNAISSPESFSKSPPQPTDTPSVSSKASNQGLMEDGGFFAFLAQMKGLTEQPIDTCLREFVPLDVADQARAATPQEDHGDADTVRAKNKDPSKLNRSRTVAVEGGGSMQWSFSIPSDKSHSDHPLLEENRKGPDFREIPLSYSPSARMQPWGPNASDLWNSTSRLLAAIPEEVASVMSTASLSFSFQKHSTENDVGEEPLTLNKSTKVCLAVSILAIVLLAAGAMAIVVMVVRATESKSLVTSETLSPTLDVLEVNTATPTIFFVRPTRPPSNKVVYSRSPLVTRSLAPSIVPYQQSYPTMSPSFLMQAGGLGPIATESPSVYPSSSNPQSGSEESMEPIKLEDNYETANPTSDYNSLVPSPITPNTSAPNANNIMDDLPPALSNSGSSLEPSSRSDPMSPHMPTYNPDYTFDNESPSTKTTTASPSTSNDRGRIWESFGTIEGKADLSSVRISGSGHRAAVATSNELFVAERNADGDWETLGDAWSIPYLHAISLSDDGSTVALATYQARNDDSNNTVSVYRWDGQIWKPLGSTPLSGSCAFSGSLDLNHDGNVIAIGNPFRFYYAGYVSVLKYNETSDEWELLGDEIIGRSPGDMAGTSVSLSLSGHVLGLGSPGKTIDHQISLGQVLIFHFDVAMSRWFQVGQPLNGYERLKQFGYALSLSGSGSHVAVSAPFVDYQGSLRGIVYVYKISSITNTWELLGSPIEGLYIGDLSGTSISLSKDGTTLAIGAPRRRYVQVVGLHPERNWIPIGFVESDDNRFGSSVALSSNGRILGVCGSHTGEDGNVYWFARVDDIALRKNG